MTTQCRRIEALLTPYVDGEAGPTEIAAVNAHLAACPECRALVAAGQTIRGVIRARASHLRVAAPPGLRTRIVARLDERVPGRLGWTGRLSALAAAAAAVLVVVVTLELVTPRSNVLVAAQLALDHLRCFVVERHSTQQADADALQQQLLEKYGWRVEIPPSDREAGVTLVSARRCPYWLGPYAHLLYRAGGHEISLYVTQAREQVAGEMQMLGLAERTWVARGHAYALVTGDLAAGDLARVTSYLQRQTSD